MILDLISTEKQQSNLNCYLPDTEKPHWEELMRQRRIGFLSVLVLTAAAATSAFAQNPSETTRFTIGGAPVLALPKGEFGSNIGRNFGGIVGLNYHVDRPGYFSLRFDVSPFSYGSEERQVPISPWIGERILLDLKTRNWMTAFSFGPELALPRGPLRPYVNSGISHLLLKTTSSLQGDSSESFVTSTNYSDSTRSWFLGGGLRIPLAGDNPYKAISLDLGLRYQKGGSVSYLREGSIQDLPDGSINFTPLVSRTPHIVYLIGVRYRIPHNPGTPCLRILC
jgi:hypothetical protein